MKHSHKVVLALGISLAIGAISAYLLLDTRWFQELLPVDMPQTASVLSLFAVFTIFVFDLMVLAIEG